MTKTITLNFCWLHQWHIGVLLLVLINLGGGYVAYTHWIDLTIFDSKHPDKEEIILPKESGYSSPEPMGEISSKNWMGEGLLITGIVISDFVAWLWINSKLELVELKLKNCSIDGSEKESLE